MLMDYCRRAENNPSAPAALKGPNEDIADLTDTFDAILFATSLSEPMRSPRT